MLQGALIGCGFFGRIQLEAWQRVPEANIAAVCDLDLSKAQELELPFGVKAYDNPLRMLDEVQPDFVDIATRPSTHVDLVRDAAARGIPILLQKPLAPTWREARRIVDFAAAAGVRLMINENWRWQRWYREIGSLISKGTIGEVFYYNMHARARDGLGPAPYVNQPYFKDMERFLVFETLVHHMDAARSLLGDIVEVYCRTSRINPIIAGEDMALIMTEHAGGVRGVIDGNRGTEPDEPGEALETARFEGDKGVLRLTHPGDVYLNGVRVFSGADLPGYRGDSCRATQQHFVQCLQSGNEFETDGAGYLKKTFAAVEACYRSADQNRPVRLEEITGG
jgi:D-apiose dehydrogenase